MVTRPARGRRNLICHRGSSRAEDSDPGTAFDAIGRVQDAWQSFGANFQLVAVCEGVNEREAADL